MSPEERRNYNATKMQRTRERRQAGLEPLRTPRRSENNSPKSVLTLIREGAPDTMYGQKAIPLRVDLAKRLLNAAAALPFTQAEICEIALLDILQQLEAEHNDGQPFPDREVKRPVWRKTISSNNATQP